MKKNIVVAVALLALMAAAVFAQQYDPESDFIVTKNGNAVTITGYKGGKAVVNIPPTIQGSPVTAIGDSNGKSVAFQNQGMITSVIIPDSVTSIAANAFRGCNKLASVTIGAGVKQIGPNAFAVCPALTSVTFKDKAATDPSGLAMAAFADAELYSAAWKGGAGPRSTILKATLR